MIFSPFAFQNYSATGYVVTDTDAQAYLNQVAAVGGSLNTTINEAVDTLFTSLKTSNLYASMSIIYPFVGGTPAAHTISAKAPTTSAQTIEWKGGLTSGSSHSNAGCLVNQSGAITGYGKIPLTPAQLYSTSNSQALGIYQSSVSVTGTSMDVIATFRADDNYYSGKRHQMDIPGAGTVCNLCLGDNYGLSGFIQYDNTTAPIGFWVGSRTSSTNMQLYRNGTSVATNITANGGSLESVFTVQLFGQQAYLNGVGSHVGIVSFMFLGCPGLSSTQVSSLNTIVQAFETKLGRNV